MSPPLKQDTAQQLIVIVERLKREASFSRILFEANRRGVLAWHRTLRRYLDLLVLGRVLSVEKTDVGSVRPRENYKSKRREAEVWAGPAILKRHGLNWHVEDGDMYSVNIDLEGLVRSKPFRSRGETRLAACLEDSLAYELKKDRAEHTGGTELVAALLATRPVDLPYLLRRADKLGIGRATRLILRKIIDTFTSLPESSEGRLFLNTRDNFLRILRQYSSRSFLNLLEHSKGEEIGQDTFTGLSSDSIVLLAAKQLGITG